MEVLRKSLTFRLLENQTMWQRRLGAAHPWRGRGPSPACVGAAGPCDLVPAAFLIPTQSPRLSLSQQKAGWQFLMLNRGWESVCLLFELSSALRGKPSWTVWTNEPPHKAPPARLRPLLSHFFARHVGLLPFSTTVRGRGLGKGKEERSSHCPFELWFEAGLSYQIILRLIAWQPLSLLGAGAVQLICSADTRCGWRGTVSLRRNLPARKIPYS